MSPSQGAVEQRRASFLRSFGVLSAAIALMLAAVQAVDQRWDLAGVCAVTALMCGLVPLLVALGRARLAAGWMTLVLWVATTFAVVEGGLSGPTVGYVALLPIAASLTSGPRAGALALLLGLATISALVPFQPWQGNIQGSLATNLTGSLLVGLVGLAGLLLARLTDRLTRALEVSRRAAQAADVAKSRLLANCSHDLRTPLNAVLGYADLLREEAIDGDRPEVVEDLDRVEQAARQLLAKVDRVLELARIEAGKVIVEPRCVPLRELLGRREIDLTEDVTANVDPVVFSQVVDALHECVDADSGAVHLKASLPRRGWLRLHAIARSGEAPIAIIADTVVARLAAHLGGQCGGRAGERWVELPIS